MLRYIFKRLLMMIPVILGITFIIFAIMSFTPGDPARLILGEDAPPEDVAELRNELGLDDPFATFQMPCRVISALRTATRNRFLMRFLTDSQPRLKLLSLAF